MKLKARMEMATKKPGIINHGYNSKTWVFWACWSKTPQLVKGGRSPNPKKLRADSARIIEGIERVAITII
jgi:hypothetical protein